MRRTLTNPWEARARALFGAWAGRSIALFAAVGAIHGCAMTGDDEDLAVGMANLPPTPVQWNLEFHNRQGILDTQGGYDDGPPETWVRNPTPCAWGDQDQILRRGDGMLEAGTETTDTLCLIADYDDSGNVSSSIYPKAIAFKVYAPHDTLEVSVTSSAGDSWTAGPSVPAGNRRLWQLCVADPVADAANTPNPLSSYWPPVPDSNGGYGQRVDYTIHVRSPARTSRDVVALFEIHGGGNNRSFAPRSLDVPCPEPDGR